MLESNGRSKPLRSIVTGAGGRLGSSICKVLVDRGDQVVAMDIRDCPHAGCDFIAVDLRDRSSVDDAVHEAVRKLGGLDVLIHAAGIIQTGSFMELSDEAMRDHLEINLLGAMRICQSAALHMLSEGGRIVIVTSIHGQIGVAGRAAYAASKGGMAAMGRVMAAELAKHRIRVNMLSPGPIDGGMTPDPQARAEWVSATPAKRVADLSEVARTAAMLTSDDASFVNGQTIAIDGGASTVKTW